MYLKPNLSFSIFSSYELTYIHNFIFLMFLLIHLFRSILNYWYIFFGNPNILFGNKDRCSTHQSSLVLRMCSVILYRADDKAIGLYAAGLVLGLGIGMTLNWSQVLGIKLFVKRLLRIFYIYIYKCCNRIHWMVLDEKRRNRI